jgi:hypothetical protein
MVLLERDFRLVKDRQQVLVGGSKVLMVGSRFSWEATGTRGR